MAKGVQMPDYPVTRKERYLAKAAGQTVDLPEYDKTREEAYWRAIAENGGSGGDVTKAYVDEQIADVRAEYPIADTVSGDDISVTGTADANVQKLTIYGRSEVVEGEIVSIGDGGSLTITTANSDSSESSTATLATGLPLCGIPVNSGETYTDGNGQKWLADTASVEGVVKRCYKVTFDGSEDEGWTFSNEQDRAYIAIPGTKAVSSDTAYNLVSNAGNAISYDSIYADTTIQGLAVSSQGNLSIRVLPIMSTIQSATEWKTYLASNPVTIVYELATPITQELTSAEKSALLSLKTFDSTTNLTIIDDPWADFGYIKNTANGKAVEQLADNLRVALGRISAAPEMHRNIFRGKYLGTAVTAAQLAAIDDGTFDDLFVGDYWTMGGVNWRIADMDYWLGCGDTAFNAHHLVIVPDTCLYNAKMNDENVTTGGYVGSKMYTENLNQAKTTINSLFVDMVLTHREYLVNAVSNGKASGGAWFDSTVELMNESMVYGHREFTPGCDGTTIPANYTINKTQLALFALAPKFITNRANQWLRDVVSAANFALVGSSGSANSGNASASRGVRPVFAIGVSE